MKPLVHEMEVYAVKPHAMGDLAEAELVACIAIIKRGNAVNPRSVEAELPRASVVAVARKGPQIVGAGAIKRIRRAYASRIADRSGVSFDPETPELGYVAV